MSDAAKATSLTSPPTPPTIPPTIPINRRAFLRRTLLGAALLAFGGTILENLRGYVLDDKRASALRVLSPKEALVFAAVAARMLAPDEQSASAAIPSPDELSVVQAADDYLVALPPHLAADVKALLQLVEHSPFLFSLRPSRYTHLPADAQDAVLEDWATSRLALRRQGFVALKSLAMMAFYGNPKTFAIPGYPGPLLPA